MHHSDRIRGKADDIKVSVVIPAFNEEKSIGSTIASLRDKSCLEKIELIVVDNGSTDKTTEVVNSYGEKVVQCPVGTIAAVRNYGVKQCDGEILIFLDADVVVTDNWRKNIFTVCTSLAEDPYQIIGSRCLPRSNDGFLNKYWYSRLSHYKAEYVNSGHLITTRFLFNGVGGFNEELETAEDYHFCLEAKKVNAKITLMPDLQVIHNGYPETLTGFIKREKWHGTDDVKSLSSFGKSKIAWVSAFCVLLLVVVILLTVKMHDYRYLIIYPVSIALISAGLTIYKFGRSSGKILVGTSFIFCLYLAGRAWALVSRAKSKL